MITKQHGTVATGSRKSVANGLHTLRYQVPTISQHRYKSTRARDDSNFSAISRVLSNLNSTIRLVASATMVVAALAVLVNVHQGIATLRRVPSNIRDRWTATKQKVGDRAATVQDSMRERSVSVLEKTKMMRQRLERKIKSDESIGVTAPGKVEITNGVKVVKRPAEVVNKSTEDSETPIQVPPKRGVENPATGKM